MATAQYTPWTPTPVQRERAAEFSLALIALLKSGRPLSARFQSIRQRAVMRVLRYAAKSGAPLRLHLYPKGAMR